MTDPDWATLDNRRLPRCARCYQRPTFPPLELCISCWSADKGWHHLPTADELPRGRPKSAHRWPAASRDVP
jgi:hypothetical protein